MSKPSRNYIYKLYIDESGSPHPNHTDKNYTLAGVIVRQYQSDELKIKADQIKFKYWGKTNIVFHSTEIGKHLRAFEILKDPKIKDSFMADFFNFLENSDYRLVIVSINKEKMPPDQQKSKNIQSLAFEYIIKYFATFLEETGSKGQILMETSGGTDIELHKKFTEITSHGISDIGIDNKKVKDLLTSVSFVSKNNEDIETQLADIFAYPATKHFLHMEGLSTITKYSYEDKIIEIINRKLIYKKTVREKGIKRLP